MAAESLPPGISMIVPIYNTGEMLVDNITAVAEQPFDCPHELLLVDDGSTDPHTREAIQWARHEFAFVGHIALGQNMGVQIARSAGVEAAQYKYVQVIDGDDKLSTDAAVLAKGTFADQALEILESDDAVAFVHCFWEMFGDYHGPTLSSYPTSATQILEKHHMQTSIVYPKADAVTAGLYAPSIRKFQDWSFAVGLLNSRLTRSMPQEVACVEDFYYNYRIHAAPDRLSAQSISEADMVQETIRLYPEIFKRHYPDTPDELLADEVLRHKPSRLEDLLHIARYDLELAKRIQTIRGYELTSNIGNLGVW